MRKVPWYIGRGQIMNLGNQQMILEPHVNFDFNHHSHHLEELVIGSKMVDLLSLHFLVFLKVN